MDKKLSILFIVTGIGIGIVLASIINIVSPTVIHSEYSESEIKEKARELGMVDIKENIEQSMENSEESKSSREDELEEENNDSELENTENMIVFEIQKGENSEVIIDNLYELNIIDDKEKFEDLVFEKDAAKRFRYGIYQIKKDTDYEKVIEILTRQ